KFFRAGPPPAVGSYFWPAFIQSVTFGGASHLEEWWMCDESAPPKESDCGKRHCPQNRGLQSRSRAGAAGAEVRKDGPGSVCILSGYLPPLLRGLAALLLVGRRAGRLGRRRPAPREFRRLQRGRTPRLFRPQRL